MRLEGTTAFITGASSGLGRAAAILAAEEGAEVVNADIQSESRDGGKPTDKRITEAGGNAAFIKTDVTDFEQVSTAMDQAVETFGTIDIVVNNAGRAESYALSETEEENWEGTLELNLTGVYHGCRAGVERMLEGDGGAIVNIGSVFGIVGAPNSASYSASKGGVISLTKQVARDYAQQGIRVNAVSPGFIDTPMLEKDTHDGTVGYATQATPMGRIGHPEEIADAVIYLASNSASFITGQNLVVDGGFVMS